MVMRVMVGQTTFEIVEGNIVEQDVDAIVNAANTSLQGGGGVDGAIHRAAGPELAQFCRNIGRCPPGEARLTPGFRLRAPYVIHTVGPVYRGGVHGEADVLRACYQASLQLAAQHNLRSVAFPAISTGIYGYPMETAARIALTTVREFVQQHDHPTLVRFVLRGQNAHIAYETALDEILKASSN